MSKKRSSDSDGDNERAEVEFETPSKAITFETPRRETVAAKRKPNTTVIEPNAGCWCGKHRRECDGNPTHVYVYPGGTRNYICPAGRARTDPPAKVVQAADEAGLATKKTKKGRGTGASNG